MASAPEQPLVAKASLRTLHDPGANLRGRVVRESCCPATRSPRRPLASSTRSAMAPVPWDRAWLSSAGQESERGRVDAPCGPCYNARVRATRRVLVRRCRRRCGYTIVRCSHSCTPHEVKLWAYLPGFSPPPGTLAELVRFATVSHPRLLCLGAKPAPAASIYRRAPGLTWRRQRWPELFSLKFLK